MHSAESAGRGGMHAVLLHALHTIFMPRPTLLNGIDTPLDGHMFYRKPPHTAQHSIPFPVYRTPMYRLVST